MLPRIFASQNDALFFGHVACVGQPCRKALVADAMRHVPDLVPDFTRSGLGRLQRLALDVSGVAVAERQVNPFARWVSAA